MIRHAAGVTVALCLSTSPLYAQSAVFKVGTTLANVRKSPSTASPVIGKAKHGAVLEVTSELGRWVKVKWTPAADGVGYVHVSTGLIARGSAAVPYRAAGQQPAAPPATRSASSSAVAPAPARAESIASPSTTPTQYITTPSHVLGLGGLVGGPALGIGASARVWPRRRVGLQVELSRDARIEAPGRVTSVQLAPSVMCALRDRVRDDFWVRPYLGAGPTLQHQTLDIVSDTRLGFQAFGGAEVTLAGVPRLALSADIRYHWLDAAFAGVESGGPGLLVSGHWYFK
jgi:hypothetical protein